MTVKKEYPPAATDGLLPQSHQNMTTDGFIMIDSNQSLKALEPNIQEAERYLDILGGKDVPRTFQLIRGSEDPAPILHGRLSELASRLKTANIEGYGVFVVPNKTNLKGRRSKDIEEIQAVFVDIDETAEARGISREELIERLINGFLKPHMIVESSTDKFHGYWRVSGCCISAFKEIQQRLATEFGGDLSICDPSRVMRVAGFYHHKAEPVLTRIVHTHKGPLYTMEQLQTFLGEQSSPLLQSQKKPLKASWDKGYCDGERTLALTQLSGQAIAAGLSDEEMVIQLIEWNKMNTPPLSLKKITDTALSIRRTHIRKLGEKDSVVDEYNQTHAVALHGSKCVVIKEVQDGFLLMSPVDFERFECNKRTANGESLAKLWMNSSNRRTYTSMVFDPSGRCDPSQFNLWKGFARKPVKGDCPLILQHMRNIICGGNEEQFQYLLNWAADAVQNPAKLPGVALVMMGELGIGKGVFVEYLKRIFGNHFCAIQSMDQLVGRFNGHLSQSVLVFADEAITDANKNYLGKLKTLITEETRIFEMKNRDAIELRNYTRLIMASNEDWVVNASVDERRFCVFDVSNERKKDFEYFAAIEKERDNGGVEALLHMLLERDLSGVNIRQYPVTTALINQKLKSLGSHQKWFYDCLQLGVINGYDWPERIPKSTLYNCYSDYCKSKGSYGAVDSGTFFKWLYQVLPETKHERKRIDGVPCRTIAIPSWYESRKAFEKWINSPVEWIS